MSVKLFALSYSSSVSHNCFCLRRPREFLEFLVGLNIILIITIVIVVHAKLGTIKQLFFII